MKTILRQFFFLVLLMIGTTAPAYADPSHQEGNLEVTIQGLANNQGVVRIALYNSGELYKNSGNTAAGSLRKVAVKITNNTAHYIFKKVPFGVYGIKVFHDIDNSGKLKTNFFGVPTEAYGFSNNPNASSGMPPFQAIQFSLNQSKVKQNIMLKKAGS